MDYGFILAFAAYIVGIQSVFRFGFRPIVGTIIAIGIPFIISSIIAWIILESNPATLWGEVITLTSLIIVTLQLSLMYLLLRYLAATDSIGGYLLSSVLGYFLIVLCIPFTIEKFT